MMGTPMPPSKRVIIEMMMMKTRGMHHQLGYVIRKWIAYTRTLANLSVRSCSSAYA